jgi:hypothetical protein
MVDVRDNGKISDMGSIHEFAHSMAKNPLVNWVFS